jgi:hypothetical protein
LRACSGGDANPSTPKSTGLKAGDKLVVIIDYYSDGINITTQDTHM